MVKLNNWNILNWEKYGKRRQHIIDLSLQGKLSGCQTTDLCLYVGKSQWGKQSPQQPREVWIGDLQQALKQKLLRRCEFSLGSNRAEGYFAAKQLKFQYLATLAVSAGRVELEALVDNEGYDRNSSIVLRADQLNLVFLP